MGMVVPIAKGTPQGAAPQAQPSQTDLLMALSEMHRQGHFAQNQQDNWDSLSKEDQNALMKEAVPLKPGTPEYNKFDEAVIQHGIVRLPDTKGDKGFDQFRDVAPSNGVKIYDLPDGSSILKREKSSGALTS